jgi:hypothetical protein
MSELRSDKLERKVDAHSNDGPVSKMEEPLVNALRKGS